MLDTLYKIGKWQAEHKSEWARFIDNPKVSWEDRKGNPLKNYIIDIVFDLDEMDVYLNKDNIAAFDPNRTAEELKAVRIKGGYNKATYATVSPKNIKQLSKTFFGKIDEQDVQEGQLIEAIHINIPTLIGSPLEEILRKIFKLRDTFIQLVVDKESSKLNEKKLLSQLELSKNESVTLIYASIKATEHGIPEITPFAKTEEYQSYLTAAYFPDTTEKGKKNTQKLCYVSGMKIDDVTKLNLSNKYSLNKMFVTTTKNFAQHFSEKSFNKNYQVSAQNQSYLDLASNFLLTHNKVKIAEIDHVILPEFFSTEEIDFDLALKSIKSSSDLLFKASPALQLEEISDSARYSTEKPFWLTFLAFESDGKFFKTLEQIKDVSSLHFSNILDAFSDVDSEMQELGESVKWNKVNTRYGQVLSFNLNTIYRLIPVRKDKEKKNKALILIKSILENRKVPSKVLYEYFTELILCHYYGRYTAYKNVDNYNSNGSHKRDEYFYWACRDSVFKYLGFIQVLKKLQLTNMEETNRNTAKEYQDRIDAFFAKMDFTESQKAMFYLGKILDIVTYIQIEKKKTALEKVNFSGMDRDDILRLRNSLIEKAKQYREVERVKFVDAQFGAYFNFNKWDMAPQEAIFFLLTGYSFIAAKPEQEVAAND